MSAVDEIRTTKDRRRARRRTAMRALRPGRTPAGAGVAGALVVLGTALVGEMVCAFAGWPTGWSGLPGVLGLAWGEPLVALTGSLMVVSGTALLLLAMIPGRPRLVPLEVGDDGLVLGLTRAGLKRTLVAVAMTVSGVDLAFVRLRRGQIEVTVLTRGNRTGGLLKEVGAAVGDRLEGLGVHGRHEVVVRLRRKSS
ncbi:DUF6286 domain-containing protein [Herbidospora sp. NBRC 101105]|uniref:DUF6286 domain-containing protein n=1 Tax=Herbidospora sp. NBRC 101105 TaxID=3032195 RepID=UPI0024A1104F|nr:DUF6286 domain-containing protein [Herbidospora sp. NBRC 101105]GLX98130.1 hypothetical protein Hesp01_60800 [Herbidospora sp. NBRC 101105]